MGLAGIIGKGEMSRQVQEAIILHGACYFAAVGGAGALIARCIKEAQVIAFEELGCESIKRMTVESLPLTVAMDAQGGNLYQTGRAAYCRA
jgi:fumarate hydratase subunit beta